tara:strand:- start:1035 stop:1571 length:537 start_codon:yes stop_codon:yes gene_type:complete
MTQAQLKEDLNQVTLYAQPYDLDAQGFYFTSFEDYETKYNKNCNVYGQFVEEYEIQFIDGSVINSALFDAVGSYNLKAYYKVVNIWDDFEKVDLIISYKDNITSEPFNEDIEPNDLDIEVYYDMTFRELAQEFIDDGCLGDIPQHLENYIDVDKYAYDLKMDYNEFSLGNTTLIYRSM